jgi:hypothetical protein
MKKVLTAGKIYTTGVNTRVMEIQIVTAGTPWTHYLSLTPEDPDEDYQELMWGEEETNEEDDCTDPVHAADPFTECRCGRGSSD